jgi:hypothetical protein
MASEHSSAVIRLRVELDERRYELQQAWLSREFNSTVVLWLQAEIARLTRAIEDATHG